MKRGFTLIELLAVIVILAIIALIATPIVLSIINDSKENAQLRSAEMYLDAVEQAIVKYKMESGGTFNPYRCEIREENLYCDDNTEVTVEVNGEVPKSGVIYLVSGKVEGTSLKYGSKIVSTNKEGKLYYGNMEKICFPVTDKNKTTGNVPNGEYNKGDEYICEVALGTYHRFFVLSSDENKISLIMDRNICEDGTEVTEENKCLVEWNTSGLNADGPVTAMGYLYTATQNWNNIPNIIINYTDEGKRYGTVITNNNITKIISEEETEFKYENLKARLPYYSEIFYFDKKNNTNLWMFNYLKNYSDLTGEGLKNISGIYGYWTFSSHNASFDYAHIAHYAGSPNRDITKSILYGVRPVIEVLKSNL